MIVELGERSRRSAGMRVVCRCPRNAHRLRWRYRGAKASITDVFLARRSEIDVHASAATRDGRRSPVGAN